MYVSGDVFGTEITRTWEFNSSFPLRSVAIPQLFFHPSFKLLKSLHDKGLVTLSGWTIVSCSRLIMALLSLSTDFCVYSICKHLKGDYSKGLLLTASSYVTLTFMSHTFTNSFEVVLFSWLLYIVSLTQFRDSDFNKKKKARKKAKQQEVKKSEANVEESSKDTHKISYFNGMVFGVILTAGVFNRPTFLIFAFVPSLWWIINVARCSSNSVIKFLSKIYVTLASAAVMFAIFCFIDSVFYSFKARSVDNKEICNLQISLLLTNLSICLPFDMNTIYCLRKVFANCFILTPWNFIQYNTISSNLAEHGIHPFYLHFCVNMPLLFGPLMFYIFKSFPACMKSILIYLRSLQFIFSSTNSSQINKTNIENNLGRVGCASILLFIFIPVAVFSIFPHQEPRFLIPLLPLIVIFTIISTKSLSKIFIIVFIIFNITLAILFGILHQGGLLPCLYKLQTTYNNDQMNKHLNGDQMNKYSNGDQINNYSNGDQINKHLNSDQINKHSSGGQIKKHSNGDQINSHSNSDQINKHSNASQINKHSGISYDFVFAHTYMPPKFPLLIHNSNINILDLKGCDKATLVSSMLKKLNSFEEHDQENYRLFLITPATFYNELPQNTILSFSLVERFCPHLSFEDLPRLTVLKSVNFVDEVKLFLEQFCLLLMEVH